MEYKTIRITVNAYSKLMNYKQTLEDLAENATGVTSTMNISDVVEKLLEAKP